ncbi:hypothetical protein FMUND_4099 [Fusarium mundagurra]|uniref:Uncharacterized protein n=1 Tax=Fusarium mundagurra TaxID=1567541 RepID=A0A8H6DKA4_9HYPO|nr:hypothetical protein FMUND_4099 [Fusarium mundagurra]
MRRPRISAIKSLGFRSRRRSRCQTMLGRLQNRARRTVHHVNDGSYGFHLVCNQILSMIETSDKEAWVKYAAHSAKTDDLVMTAIALLYSSHMELANHVIFPHVYLNHFNRLLSQRQNTHLYTDDENYRTLIALLVVLLSHFWDDLPAFLRAHDLLLMMLNIVVSAIPIDIPQMDSARYENYASIRQWVRQELEFMKQNKEQENGSQSVGERMDES